MEIILPRITLDQSTIFEAQAVHLKDKAWTCMIGPSGVGKTTLLRYLAGLLEGFPSPFAGQKIGHMPQKDPLLPWFSCLGNVSLGALLRGERVDLARAKICLAQVELQRYETLYPHQLSMGMRQRVVLAQTLYEDDAIILLDEPFAALDLKTRAVLHALCQKVWRGRTVLHVTHDSQDVEVLADALWVLEGQPALIKSEFTVKPPKKLRQA